MKSMEQVKKIQRDIVAQLPDLVKKVAECNDEGDGLAMIASFAAKVAMVTFILEDRQIPFQIIEEAVMETMVKSFNDLGMVPVDNEDAVDTFIKSFLGK